MKTKIETENTAINALVCDESEKKTNPDRCKFCGERVNLKDEGNTYRDGSCAHEECADSHEFERENFEDFR